MATHRHSHDHGESSPPEEVYKMTNVLSMSSGIDDKDSQAKGAMEKSAVFDYGPHEVAPVYSEESEGAEFGGEDTIIHGAADKDDILTHTIHLEDDPDTPALTFRTWFLGKIPFPSMRHYITC